MSKRTTTHHSPADDAIKMDRLPPKLETSIRQFLDASDKLHYQLEWLLRRRGAPEGGAPPRARPEHGSQDG